MADQRDDSNSKEHLRSILEDLRSDPDEANAFATIEIILQQAERIDALQSKIEATVERMQGQIDRLRERVRELNAENRRLREKRDEAEQAGKRQAAPFRLEEEERSEDPGLPGREEGHKASFRREPEQIEERVEVEMEKCPGCGGTVTDVRPIRQVVEEIPPLRPKVIEVITYRGRCDRCGQVGTTHPLKTTEATGAASVCLGPRAQATALLLREGHGLTMRRACGVLRDGFGLDLSPGGLAQMIQRCAGRMGGGRKPPAGGSSQGRCPARR